MPTAHIQLRLKERERALYSRAVPAAGLVVGNRRQKIELESKRENLPEEVSEHVQTGFTAQSEVQLYESSRHVVRPVLTGPCKIGLQASQ